MDHWDARALYRVAARDFPSAGDLDSPQAGPQALPSEPERLGALAQQRQAATRKAVCSAEPQPPAAPRTLPAVQAALPDETAAVRLSALLASLPEAHLQARELEPWEPAWELRVRQPGAQARELLAPLA